MRTTLKLLLVSLTATATLAFTTSIAWSALTVSGEPAANCGTVTLTVHTVSGGCHVNLTGEGRVPLFAHIPGTGEVQVSSCFIDVEAQVGTNGEGYVKRATLTLPDANCTRRPCDEANMTFRPARFHIRETGPATERVVITFCLRSVPEGEGAPGTNCTLTLPGTSPSTHRYEGTATSAQRCAENAAVSFGGHGITPAAGSERVEVTHT